MVKVSIDRELADLASGFNGCEAFPCVLLERMAEIHFVPPLSVPSRDGFRRQTALRPCEPPFQAGSHTAPVPIPIDPPGFGSPPADACQRHWSSLCTRRRARVWSKKCCSSLRWDLLGRASTGIDWRRSAQRRGTLCSMSSSACGLRPEHDGISPGIAQTHKRLSREEKANQTEATHHHRIFSASMRQCINEQACPSHAHCNRGAFGTSGYFTTLQWEARARVW